MEKAVAKQFSDSILHDAATRFNVTADGAKLLGDFENYVYEVRGEQEPFILRLTHSSHRDEAQILSELEWVNYLGGQDIGVARAYPSEKGNLVEIVDAEDSYFAVSLFEKAQGKGVSPKNKHEWNGRLFHKWGQTIGRMHRATKQYKLKPGIAKRPEWDGDDLILNLANYLSGQDVVLNRANELLGYFELLPKDRNTYGLLHTDVHPGNFFMNGSEMTVFDFDDCTYHWFVRDISIALYYALWMSIPASERQRRAEFTDKFMPAFLEGYKGEFDLDSVWLEKMPEFLMLRDLELYTVFHKKWDPSNLNEREQALLGELRTRILNKQPPVEVSFDKYV